MGSARAAAAVARVARRKTVKRQIGGWGCVVRAGCRSRARGRRRPSAAAPTTTASTSSSDLSAALLEAHAHWDWHQLVKEMLLPFSAGIEEMQLETGVKRCNDNGTMYCTRIQVVANRLYLTDYRAIFFDRHYAPARIMLLRELLKRRSIPDLALVVAVVRRRRWRMVWREVRMSGR